MRPAGPHCQVHCDPARPERHPRCYRSTGCELPNRRWVPAAGALAPVQHHAASSSPVYLPDQPSVRSSAFGRWRQSCSRWTAGQAGARRCQGARAPPRRARREEQAPGAAQERAQRVIRLQGRMIPQPRAGGGSPRRPPRQRAEQRPAGDAPLAAQLEPAPDECDRARVDAHDPPLAALAPLDDERASFRVEVLRLERERLAEPKHAAPEHGDQRPVAHRRRRPPRALSQQQLDLRDREQVTRRAEGALPRLPRGGRGRSPARRVGLVRSAALTAERT